jgi:hypothetical protein
MLLGRYVKHLPGTSKRGFMLAAITNSAVALLRTNKVKQVQSSRKHVYTTISILGGTAIAYFFSKANVIKKAPMSHKGSLFTVITQAPFHCLIISALAPNQPFYPLFPADEPPYEPPAEIPHNTEIGITTPEWRVSANGERSLHRLPVLHFANSLEQNQNPDGSLTVTLGDRENFKISLSEKDIAKDILGGLSKIPSLTLHHEGLDQLTRKEQNFAVSSTQALLSNLSPVTLPQELRTDYNIPESATEYAFVNPLQLNPADPGATARVMSSDEIPSIVKELAIIGGYIYKDNTGKIVGLKVLTANPDATEILVTGKAIDIPDDNSIVQEFKRGIEMTNGQGDWNQPMFRDGIESDRAHKVTAPMLLPTLTHFSYVPQSDYHGLLKAQAPHGLFIYKTESGKFQVAPIGGNFEPPPVPVDQTGIIDDPSIPPSTLLLVKQLINNPLRFHTFIVHGQAAFLQENQNSVICDGYTCKYDAIANELSITKGPQHLVIKMNAAGDLTQQVEGGNLEIFNAFFRTLSARCIKVDGQIIQTIRDMVLYAPIEHLKRFTGGAFRVSFYDPSVGYSIAIDAGGPTREYVNQIILGVKNTPYFSYYDGIHLPNFSNSRAVGEESDEANQTFDGIGRLFAAVYKSNGYFQIGIHFHPKLFDLLLEFKDQELNNQPLSTEVLERISLTHLHSDQTDTVLDIINRDTITNVSDFDLEYIASLDLDDLGAESWDDLKTRWLTTYKGKAREIFFKETFFRKVEAARRIAVSMSRSLGYQNPWNTIKLSGSASLNRTIQGTLTKESIAQAIRYSGNNQNVVKKVQWMRDIILASEEDTEFLKQFVLCVRGTPSLPSGCIIRIDEFASDSPYPNYHTCFTSIKMPHGVIDRSHGPNNHRTKDSFELAWRESITIALAAGGFQMG